MLSQRDQIAALLKSMGGSLSNDYQSVNESDFNAQVIAQLKAVKGITAKENDDTSERRFRDLFEASPDPIFIEDYNGIVLDANPAACALHQMSYEDIVGFDIFLLFDDKEREGMREQFNQFIKGERSRLDSTSPVADGSKMPISIHSKLIEYQGKDAVMLVVHDVSSYKELENALRKSERKYRALFEGSDGLMCTHDLDGTFRTINAAGIEMLNMTADSVIGVNIRDVLTMGAQDLFDNYINEIITKKIAHGVMKLRSKTGQERFIVYKNVLHEEDGQESYVIGSGADITERIMMEKALEEANAKAEVNIQRLNDALDELESANIEVQKSAVVKEEFLANMSHEIRTPLNAIIGFTELLLETNLNDEQAEHAQVVNGSSRQLLMIVNEILDYSKLEAGKLRIEATAFDVRQIVRHECKVFGPRAAEKQLEFSCSVDNDALPLEVIGDPYRLRQILDNLINNAIKFTTKGTVRLQVDVVEKKEHTVTLEFKVIDSGIGVSAEHQQAIFENFVQAKSSTTREYGGTGLGLAIVKRLVEVQHGTIKLNSELGKGAEFCVQLTYSINQAPASILPSESSGNGQVKLPTLSILLAEDNELNRKLTIKALEDEGHQVKIAVNGREAIEQARQHNFDLVLMDIQMPELDGASASQILRNELGLKVPIIALTANTLQRDIDYYIQMGMTAHLSKPFRKHQLLEAIYNNVVSGSDNNEQETELVDLSSLYELADDDPTFINDVLKLFVAHTPESLESLKLAIDTGDHKAINAHAHRMKSSYSSIGCFVGNKLLGALEESASKGESVHLMAPRYKELAALSEDVLAILAAKINA